MSDIEILDQQTTAQNSLRSAMDFHSSGDLEHAQQEYTRVLATDYRAADVLPLLAGIVAERGDIDLALYYWDKLLDIQPGHLVGLLKKGGLLHGLSKFDEAAHCFRVAKGVAPTNTVVRNNLAAALSAAGRKDEALVEFSELLLLQPGNIDARHQFRRLAAAIVPFWHAAMMNDTERNDAFEKAILRAVELRGAQAQVLDIGTGSGLLSMMAARAGAEHIVTCEIVPAIARAAEKIIAANGYGAAVTVVSGSSTDVSVGQDLPRRADILVSEILSSDLLAEDVLSTFEDARSRLLHEDAIVIPRRATAIGCLAASDTLSKFAHVGEVSGFDVSSFNSLAPQRLPLHGTMTEWTRLSDDFELVSLDLAAAAHPPGLRKVSIPVQADGVAVGVVQWLSVELIDDIVFSNHPDDRREGHWLQMLHTFPEPVPVRAGEELQLVVGHDRTSIVVAPAR